MPTRDAQPFNREDKQRRVAVVHFCQRTAAVVCLSSQTLGSAGMQSRTPMNVQRALSGRHSNASTAMSAARCTAEPVQRSSCLHRRGSLKRFKNPAFGKALVVRCEITACSKQMQTLRRSAKPKTRGRAATSFARGGGFGLLASGVTQRTMRAGSVPQSALPNPSINRTCPGKPGHAGYLKRWASR
jgi:hypothetical protein